MPFTCHSSLATWHSGGAGPLAHLVQTGFGGFYDGMAHWACTPEDVMLVLALSLLAGLGGKERARELVLSLPAAWFAGGALALLLAHGGPPALATTLSCGLAGLLVALDRRLPAAVFLTLALLAGSLHGASNGAAMAATGSGWLGIAGATLAVFVVVSLLPALLVGVKKPAARVAMRVGGSWIAAAALLMAGWLMRSR